MIKKLMLFALLGTTPLWAQEKPENRGINLKYMDTSVKPSDDFFRYVNGKWFDATEIPADRSRWGSFDELKKNTDDDVMKILNKALNDKTISPTSDQGKAIALYQSILDTVGRNKLGIKPLEPYLKQIDKIKNVNDLIGLLIKTDAEVNLGFLGAYVGTDAKNSTRNVVNIGLGSLGLPDRDYYLADDADSKEKRAKYLAHLERMLLFLKQKPAEAKTNAQKILDLETALATPRLDRVERRDRRKTYNPITVKELNDLTSTINWTKYLTETGYGTPDTVIVSQPKYLSALNDIFKAGDVETWKAYMKWTLLNSSTSELTTAIETANWEFYSKTLKGAKKQLPRTETALQAVNGVLGEALGKLYVAEKFPQEAKDKAKAMIENVFVAFENRIQKLPWMTPETKKNAIEKIRKSNVKIGYPDQWKDYSALSLINPSNGGTLFANNLAISKWNHIKNLEKLGKPVDKTEWFMSPQTVNAYYNPSYNEIVFPAAILQPPFYDYKADEAVNYGGIGAVIGHEISHGFDDSGSRYDADGNLVNWWSEDDLKQFTTLGTALASQYSELQPLPGIFVDGKFTLGENIGDLGGVNAAYDGLQLFLQKNGRPETIDGFTPEQRFFLSWATIWRNKSRDEFVKNQVKTDSHSPAMYRAYVPLQNVDVFYQAFDIKEGDKMYIAPEKRVKIW